MSTGAATGVVDLLAESGGPGEPEVPALVGPDDILDRRELEDAVSRRAHELRAAGVHPGAIHPLTVEPDREAVLSLLALWRLGVTAAPLNARLTPHERKVATDALASVAPGAQVVLWTSGTSGRPRGVALGAANLRASTHAVAGRLGLDGSEWWHCSLSPAHVGGLVLIVRALLTGATLIVPGRFDAGDVVRLLDDEDRPAWLPRPVTHASFVPTQLARVMDAWHGGAGGGRPVAPDGLRCVLIGGAHAPADLVRTATGRGWPLALTYGMTETTSQVATAPPEHVRRKPGSAGPPLDGIEIRVDERDEILVRGPMLALGYVGGRAEPLADEDGWYHTGDLGTLDEEGDLWVTGRRSERIISGGVTVDALEVEEALRAHPAVVEACVVGIPSPEWGETVAAAIVPVWAQFDLPDVERFLRQRLSAAKRPRVWKMEGELPRNANGKTDRIRVRALFDAS